MTKNLKKILLIGVSLLMMSTAGASINLDSVNAHHVHSRSALHAYRHKRNLHKYNKRRAQHIKNVHAWNLKHHYKKNRKHKKHLSDQDWENLQSFGYDIVQAEKGKYSNLTPEARSAKAYVKSKSRAFKFGWVCSFDGGYIFPKYVHNKEFKKGWMNNDSHNGSNTMTDAKRDWRGATEVVTFNKAEYDNAMSIMHDFNHGKEL